MFSNRFPPILLSVLKVREALLKGNFWDQNTADRFMQLFQQFVEILKYDFDPIGYTINIKIKKTAAKKMNNYSPNALFYYNIIGNIMMLILKENKERVIYCLQNYRDEYYPNGSVYDVYFALISNPTYLYNLANVQCIMDNVVQIIL